MNIIEEYMIFLNNESEKQSNKLTKSDAAKASVGAFIAKKSLDHGLHRLVGLRGETHTTSKDNAKLIKKSGNILDPNKGGTGASKTIPRYKDSSSGYSHITGYNDKTKIPGASKKVTRFTQPIIKKLQKLQYRAASHPNWDASKFRGKKDVIKSLSKGFSIGKTKTFHVVGSEDFYNKHFVPDSDDVALKTKKPIKVSNSKLGATIQGIKRNGLKGLKSSPKSRPLIGAAILASGGYGSYKLIEPAVKKITTKYKDANPDHVKMLIKNKKFKDLKKYLENLDNK